MYYFVWLISAFVAVGFGFFVATRIDRHEGL